MKKVLFVLTLVLFLAPNFASADIPPPPGYKETCTKKIQEARGGSCEQCSSSFNTPSKCKDLWEKKGYKKRCQSHGGSYWDEVWCKGKLNPIPEKPKGVEAVGEERCSCGEKFNLEPAGTPDAGGGNDKAVNQTKDSTSGNTKDEAVSGAGIGCSMSEGQSGVFRGFSMLFVAFYFLMMCFRRRKSIS